MNNYAPNSHQLKFLKNLYQKTKAVQAGHLILRDFGDFNMVANPKLDTTLSTRIHQPYLGNFIHMRNFMMLGDASMAKRNTIPFFLLDSVPTLGLIIFC